ncbi:MAG: tripartite tricarboxylate transporter permease [Nanoarchaeota archaeon]|nr:tripartite tricarboxylate transporter permease [Nanoarchaeota archaeon]
MIFQLITALLVGILVGTFTGLIPGIHINLVGAFLISLSTSLFFKIPATYLVVFITSMAITHTFVDFIPSIFLGCPDTDTELSVLPGHELLKKGLGYEAILLTNKGSLAAIFLLLIIAIPSVFLISKINNLMQILIPYLLIFTSVFLISSEKKKLSALLVFFLSGFLGFCVLNLTSINQPLFPLLTGLFGSSMLVLSIKNKFKVPKQKLTISKTKAFKPLLGALVASPLCSFLPGLGSGQAAIIGNSISKTNKKGFLILLGATNTLVMGFSFISLYVISKARTGAAIAILEIIGNLSWKVLILILLTTLISGLLSFIITKKLAKVFSQKIEKINYTKLSLVTLIFLGIIVFLISGFFGFMILLVSTLTGIYCISLKVRRTNMMGCLLIPTIILYLL